jgi:asparagine N-glycosylation enzyme membrane subunit Stt3
MKVGKPPKTRGAWSMTAAAVLSLISLVGSGDNPKLAILLGFVVIVLVLYGVDAWKKYFEGLVDYKVKEALEGAGNARQELFERPREVG